MKKTIKFIILIILLIALLVFLFYMFTMHNKKAKQVAVLSYHNIIPDNIQKDPNEYDTLNVSEFEKEMDYLKGNGYISLTADELYKWKCGEIEIPDKSVFITFDDAYYSFKYLVQPILEKYDFNAICFVIGNATNDNTPEYDPNVYGTIGLDEINNHIKNVEYGSHTYALHMLTDSNEKLVRTLTKEDLEQDVINFNTNIFSAKYLAYPYYTYTNEFIDVLKKYNYKMAFAGEEEMATKNVDNFKIPRISASKSFDEFKEIFESDKYRNKYGNGLIRKIFVTLERKLK